MAHVRESIRSNATTAVTSLSTTGSRVYRSRVYPLAHAKLPGLCVYCEGESTQTDTMGASSTLDRELDLMIEAYVRGTANYDNTLDDICAEVEAGLAADMTRGGLQNLNLVTKGISRLQWHGSPFGLFIEPQKQARQVQFRSENERQDASCLARRRG